MTTKVHALADGRGRLLVVRLTAGNVHDTTMFAALLVALRVARPGVHVGAGEPGPLELSGVGEVG